MSPHFLAHIIYILETVELLEQEAAKGKEHLQEDAIAYRGVLYSLQTLAESASKLPEDIKSRHTGIPWQQIVGLRNVLAHDYLGEFDAEVIWKIIQYDLPALKNAMQKHVPNLAELRLRFDKAGD